MGSRTKASIPRVGAIMLLITAGLLLSQPLDTGTLSGIVYDQAGGRLDRAAVTVRNIVTGFELLTRPSSKGEYRLENLPVGQYAVRASANGLSTVQINDVVIQANKTSTLNVTLPVANYTPISVVEVSEASEPVQASPSPASSPAGPSYPPADGPNPETIAKAITNEINALRDRLALSAEQQLKARAIFQDRQHQVANARNDSSLPPQARREKIKDIRAEAEARFRALLNENQSEEYDEILRERRERAVMNRDKTVRP